MKVSFFSIGDYLFFFSSLGEGNGRSMIEEGIRLFERSRSE